MKVSLMSHSQMLDGYETVKGLTELDSIVAHAVSKCYATTPNNRAIKRCLDNGHTSIFEHIYFTFDIKGISRSCLAQLTRHRHASYTVESQRYVDYTSMPIEFVFPSTLDANFVSEFSEEITKMYRYMVKKQGLKPEDVRSILPQATETNLTMSINARSLFNFLKLRLDRHSQAEIRELANTILKLVYPLAPITFSQFEDINGQVAAG